MEDFLTGARALGPELAALTVWTGGKAVGYGDHALRV